MLETVVAWFVTNAEKIGILTVVGVGVIAWWYEELFLGKTHRRIVAGYEKEIVRLQEQLTLANSRSERLLNHMERVVHVAEDASAVATVAIRRTDVQHRVASNRRGGTRDNDTKEDDG